MRAAAIAAVLLMALGARAAEPADAKAQAKLHFKLGRTYYDAGDYAHAVEEYQTAYKLLPLPDFLFNIAQAYRLAGDRTRALQYYARYLVLEPEGRGAAEAKQHVEELHAEEERLKPKPPPVVAKPTPPPVVVAKPAPPPVVVAKPAPPPVVVVKPLPPPVVAKPAPIAIAVTAPPERKPIYKRAWFWGVVGGAAVVVAVGVGVGVALGKSTRDPVPTMGTLGAAP